MLLLHTNTFVPQSDPLTEEDLSAAWIALKGMEGDGAKEYMVIYNCGVEAGSSQGHKHLQVFPSPGEFVLW